MHKTKILFNVINAIFIIFYIYPGSIFGFLLYGNLHKQPQLTESLIVSSNHAYAFLALSLLGLLAYAKNRKLIIINYLILSSIILEVLHLVIPSRSFQYEDLFGNLAGVLISILLFSIFNYWRKRWVHLMKEK